MNKKMIYVDCTDTVTSGSNTGIQRSVKHILSRIDVINSQFNVEIVPVVSVYSRYYKYNYHNARHYFTGRLIKLFMISRNIVDGYFKRYVKGNNSDSNQNTAVFPASQSRLINICRGVMPAMLMLTYWLDNLLLDSKHVIFRDADILFLPDSFWNESSFKAFVRAETGIKILTVHDIIPINHPNSCDDYYNSVFKNHLNGILSTVNAIISVSKSELKNVKSYCDTIRENIIYDYFYQGADFSSSSRYKDTVRESLRQLLSRTSYYLMVGSIEPRKNYDYVLNVFEKFWSQGVEISLCIVGKVNANSSSVKKRICSSANLNRRLHYFDDLSDSELAFCYDRCKAVIFPSRAEGFGLPLVEAMHYGRPVFASDIPVFREIGAGYATFFSLDNEDSLYRAICDRETLIEAQSFRQDWLSWDDAISQLFAKIIVMSNMIESQDMIQALQTQNSNS